MTPDPTPASGPEAPVPSPSAPAPKGPTLGHLLAIGAAVAGGGLVTLLVMTSRPAAREEAHVAGPASAAAARAAARPGAPTPAWSSRNQARWISNPRRNAAFELEANQPVAVWLKQVRPTLVVRCMDKRTDVFVYTDSAARIEEQDENHTVRVAFDGAAGTHERWPDSVEHDALFAPDGKAMAARLLAANQMRFTFSPHNAAPVTATFEVAGLGELLKPIAKRCGK